MNRKNFFILSTYEELNKIKDYVLTQEINLLLLFISIFVFFTDIPFRHIISIILVTVLLISSLIFGIVKLYDFIYFSIHYNPRREQDILIIEKEFLNDDLDFFYYSYSQLDIKTMKYIDGQYFIKRNNFYILRSFLELYTIKNPRVLYFEPLNLTDMYKINTYFGMIKFKVSMTFLVFASYFTNAFLFATYLISILFLFNPIVSSIIVFLFAFAIDEIIYQIFKKYENTY